MPTTTRNPQGRQLRDHFLARDIIPPDGTAIEQSKALIQSFRNGAKLLDSWQDKTSEMYAADPDLQDMLKRYLQGKDFAQADC